MRSLTICRRRSSVRPGRLARRWTPTGAPKARLHVPGDLLDAMRRSSRCRRGPEVEELASALDHWARIQDVGADRLDVARQCVLATSLASDYDLTLTASRSRPVPEWRPCWRAGPVAPAARASHGRVGRPGAQIAGFHHTRHLLRMQLAWQGGRSPALDTTLTARTMLAWVKQPTRCQPVWWSVRMGVLPRFATSWRRT
jgi:hypothetical protein